MENPDLKAAALERVRQHARELLPACLALAPKKPATIKTPQSRAALLAFKAAESFEYWDQHFELEEPKSQPDAQDGNGEASDDSGF